MPTYLATFSPSAGRVVILTLALGWSRSPEINQAEL